MSIKKITPKEYDNMIKKSSPKSKWYKDIPKAFVIGGLICTLGQAIDELFLYNNFSKEDASAWTSIILILLGAIFTALGLYQKLAKHGGAGTLVPITGFSNAVASSALEFKSEGLILGLGAKIFTIAGPVILYGTASSIIYGLVYYFFLK